MKRTYVMIAVLALFSAAVRPQELRSAKEYFDRAVANLQNAKFTEALADINKAIQKAPRVPQMYGLRGSIYFAQQNFDAAFQDFTKTIELGPRIQGIEVIYTNRALIRLFRGDYATALTDVEQALSINPHYVNALNVRGNLRQIAEDFNGAVEDFDKAISINPSYPDPYDGRGNIRSYLGDLAGALADYDKAIELNSADVPAYVGRALIHFHKGELNAALSDSERVLELDPTHWEALFDRGVIKILLGQPDDGVRDIKKAAERDPSMFSRPKQKSFVSPAESLDGFIVANPQNARAYEARGVVRLIWNKRAQAKTDLDKAIEIDSALKPEIERVSKTIRVEEP